MLVNSSEPFMRRPQKGEMTVFVKVGAMMALFIFGFKKGSDFTQADTKI